MLFFHNTGRHKNADQLLGNFFLDLLEKFTIMTVKWMPSFKFENTSYTSVLDVYIYTIYIRCTCTTLTDMIDDYQHAWWCNHHIHPPNRHTHRFNRSLIHFNFCFRLDITSLCVLQALSMRMRRLIMEQLKFYFLSSIFW